jgi:CDP-diacylglycerol--serine O-phosphatidyltransferase
MLSGLCDLFDGLVARRLAGNAVHRQLGGHLDSLVDVCSFGLAPVVLLHAAGLDRPYDVPLLVFFAIGAAWRLAAFETIGLKHHGGASCFTGLPTTYVALVLPVAFLLGFWGQVWLRLSLRIAVLGLALTMLSTLPVPKPRGACYFLFPAGGLGLMSLFIWFADRIVIES